MKQLSQKLKDGKMRVIDMPAPSLRAGHLLVRNHYSLISVGTEGSTVKTARKGYIGKAKERPLQVKQVVETIKAQGFTQTYRAVMKKLDAHSPLGYSCVGEVIGIAHDVKGYDIGSFVACGGLTASHAEIVCVPENLCVKIPPDSDLEQAAYNTLGAIAIQGVRQADLRLGETCAVIGLGLIGQLTASLLKASGVRVVGIDVDRTMVDLGARHGLDLSLSRNTAGIEERIMNFTQGIGCDAVIITAQSDSLDPINFAGAICRKRGTVVIVGAVPSGFDREPHYYRKELQVKMSCSYGPGRYDPRYEEKGLDYPVAYVRWTENRNMQAFQQLVHTKKMDIRYLTTHVFKLEDAHKAYDLIMEKSEPFIGILIKYDTQTADLPSLKIDCTPQVGIKKSDRIGIGFLGAGSFAQSYILPNIPKNESFRRVGVMTTSGTSSRSVADRFGFEFCTSAKNEILYNDRINTVFIASRHDSHADYVLQSLKAGKHVFVEKPLCLKEAQLEEIKTCYSGLNGNRPLLLVGFNRRFSKLARMTKEIIGDGPMAMTYRINSGSIPGESWIQDPASGGGRIIGEVCHFVDFLTYLNGSPPESIYAVPMADSRHLEDVLTATMKFRNGSIGTISYFSNGDKSLSKEKIEVFANGVSVVLDDFRSISIFEKGKKKQKKLAVQDKGRKMEVHQFLDAASRGKGCAISFEDIYNSTLATFKIIESMRTGNAVRMVSGSR